jgi:hypothetical protein
MSIKRPKVYLKYIDLIFLLDIFEKRSKHDPFVNAYKINLMTFSGQRPLCLLFKVKCTSLLVINKKRILALQSKNNVF